LGNSLVSGGEDRVKGIESTPAELDGAAGRERREGGTDIGGFIDDTGCSARTV
jgi:hypothetical protein